MCYMFSPDYFYIACCLGKVVICKSAYQYTPEYINIILTLTSKTF